MPLDITQNLARMNPLDALAQAAFRRMNEQAGD
jgi:hypothetical protein